MDTWWLLVVPVIFGLGWLARGFDLKELLSESTRLPRSYFNGLNFLLNDQPDRAIEAFIEVVKLDPETLELHFALGNLFRRRGETERAIRLHRNLLERADLPVNFRDQALFELAQDYLKAGLLDRAETAFQALVETPYAQRAWGFLSDVYQIESEWEKAIHATERSALDPAPRARRIAHYWCEIALLRMREPHQDATQQDRLVQAALVEAGHVDASLLRINQVQIQWMSMRKQWPMVMRKVLDEVDTHPQFAPQLVNEYLQVAKEIGAEADVAKTLVRWFDGAPSEELAGLVLQRLSAQGNHEMALQFARQALIRLPRLSVAAGLLTSRSKSGPADADLNNVAPLLAGAVARERRYECSHCGFRAQQFFWQCPGCKQWETLPFSSAANPRS
jgi:lipopolysaccharide biosynthesis regulator YciM